VRQFIDIDDNDIPLSELDSHPQCCPIRHQQALFTRANGNIAAKTRRRRLSKP
jgi:hypothetical protein